MKLFKLEWVRGFGQKKNFQGQNMDIFWKNTVRPLYRTAEQLYAINLLICMQGKVQ